VLPIQQIVLQESHAIFGIIISLFQREVQLLLKQEKKLKFMFKIL